MTHGRISIVAKHTVIPKDDVTHSGYLPGEVTSYQLSEAELAKYRAMPTVSEKKSVFIIPMRGKKA